MNKLLTSRDLTVTSVPFGVTVEWQWPIGVTISSVIEVQYIQDDRILTKQLSCPEGHLSIKGLACGEQIMIRARMYDAASIHCRKPAWSVHQWLHAKASNDAQDIVDYICKNVLPSYIAEGFCSDKSATNKQLINVGWNINRVGIMCPGSEENPLGPVGSKATHKVAIPLCETHLGEVSHNSNHYQQQTLSEVLAAYLPQRTPGTAKADAQLLAKAVKAAFEALDENDASKS